jgi:dihydroorotase
MKLVIRNGRVLRPDHQHGFALPGLTDLYIADGLIVTLQPAGSAALPGWQADREIDVRGQMVAPGLVDLSARLREPGYEYRATLESEMQAAIVGGVTTLVCPPDTDPVLDEPGLVEMLKHRARGLAGDRAAAAGQRVWAG